MEAENYILLNKDIYQHLLDYLEKTNSTEDDYEQLIDFFDKSDIMNTQELLEDLLFTLSKITKHHYYTPDLFHKAERIIHHFSEKIKQTFSNYDIFFLFKSNKRLLLYFFENLIITIDDQIADIFCNYPMNQNFHFFYPEIKASIGDKSDTFQKISIDEKFSNELNDIENFTKKRHIGHNDTYLATLIRNDSIQEFSIYCTKYNLNYSTQIENSIYETSSFLIKNKPNLIEYAAFYGSIKIFNFLINQGESFSPSLWRYAIHSNSAKMIHILEGYDVKKSITMYCGEAIKCHNHSFSEYFLNSDLLSRNIQILSIKYCNYLYFPKELYTDSVFFYLIYYDFFTVVELLLEQYGKEDGKNQQEII